LYLFFCFKRVIKQIVSLFRWEKSDYTDEERIVVSHNVTNFEFLYEPFYVAADTVPEHDERFIGYGYTRNTQV